MAVAKQSFMFLSILALASIFDPGKYPTDFQRVKPTAGPPKPLLITYPNPLEAGEFPVLLFLHGYLLSNSDYCQLMQHIASHGFIVVAPQLYTVAENPGLNTSDEIFSTAAVTNWLPEGLSQSLPQNVRPALNKLALAGHSRGGKTAFAVALGKLNVITNLKFSAIVGVDPVDGLKIVGRKLVTWPSVLTGVPHSFDFGMAGALVIGSGLGEMKKYGVLPPCAPMGLNHEEFFSECQKPAWHFVAKHYGHCDMLDDDRVISDEAICWGLCKNGESKKPMRRFVGGVIVAFLKAYLLGDSNDLIANIDKQVNSTVEFEVDCFV